MLPPSFIIQVFRMGVLLCIYIGSCFERTMVGKSKGWWPSGPNTVDWESCGWKETALLRAAECAHHPFIGRSLS
jgi:hypothetical protein